MDFVVCIGAYLGVVLATVEVGLLIAVGTSLTRVFMHVTRPPTAVLGNIAGTTVYRSIEQYPDATRFPGILIIRIDAPIYFANSTYLRERTLRWIQEEEDRLAKLNDRNNTLRYLVLDMGSVANIDTSGLHTLDELKKTTERRQVQLALANPGAQVTEKLRKSKFMERLGQKWLFLTVEEAVRVCSSSLLHAEKLISDNDHCSRNTMSNSLCTGGTMNPKPRGSSNEEDNP